MVVRTPSVLFTLMSERGSFFGDLPLGAASLSGLRAAVSSIPFATSIFLRIAAALVTRERYTLGQLANALTNLLEGRDKSDDLSVLLVRRNPSTITNHILVHLVELNDDVRGRCDLLHDPLILKLIDEEQEFLCGRTAKCETSS